MIPVVLECGGKDPVIVASDADVKLAAEYSLWSAMANAGQSCIGAERVYVVESVAEDVENEVKAEGERQARRGDASQDGHGVDARRVSNNRQEFVVFIL